ncbi:MAG TPA: tRNA1(Val) (adenine(37)-N6)-methyltransferase [Nitrospirota bacterium]|nr:tRNA1(Val) (adenine(37)-N6)-methyltransferase [Nitrospirota bacterium]
MSETLDSIKIRDLEVQVYQSKAGYRFSLDALLLADFPDLTSCKSILELGAGSGVVSLILAKRYPKAKVTGVEIQEGLYKRAVRNAEVNGLSDRVGFLHADLRDLPGMLPQGGFDLVVMNPPFRKPGTGRISPADERATARHELTAGMREVIKVSFTMLKNRGRLCLIYHPERLPELFRRMHENTFEPKRLRTVHSHSGDNARMALVEAVKGGAAGLKVLPPLFVYAKEREYTEEMRLFYGMPDLTPPPRRCYP